ncbi:SDR family NAD(P)-dependent oxidoreductase [Polyangium jinanense]|uniref:SDR family oxidoreductase n=1 Tax=Polyangium jinanense TaxID=2829994 RepID=A0A9X3X327_9BACT|nr:SDR family oxidoreductase [Polyangium jinanense]MDC3957325.1 SDR family oxidoreductase [Polyangium jinanense]MDC3982727.1 SDR family oxidoreductase [Polyangium jinanense]
MSARLSGKRCLVTGGSRNLGRAIALAFAREGARVAFTYRERDDAAEETRALLEAAGAAPLVLKGSVSDAAHVTAAVKAVETAYGGIDVLVNNAALTQVLPIALLEEAEWDAAMDTNVKGPYLFSRAALKSMIRSKKGHILNVGSFGADRVLDAPVHYAASKAALVGFSLALAKEVGRYGIAVNCLVPGLLETGLSARLPKHRVESYVAQAALGRLGTVEEVADLAAWLVSDENSFMTGGQVVIDGGL